MTVTFHTTDFLTDLCMTGFKLQALLLQKLINLVESNQVQAPLWDPAVVTQPDMTNAVFLREHIANLLQNAFAHVQRYVRSV